MSIPVEVPLDIPKRTYLTVTRVIKTFSISRLKKDFSMIKHLVEQIEGEATLTFNSRRGTIRDVAIDFPHFRGIESILEGRSALDALVISPRVCGICGHSHLMAAIRALEYLLEKIKPLSNSQKKLARSGRSPLL